MDAQAQDGKRRGGDRYPMSVAERQRLQDERYSYRRKVHLAGVVGRATGDFYGARWTDRFLRRGLAQLGWLDLPVPSIFIFVLTFTLLQFGHGILMVVAVATAGSIWALGTAIPATFIITYLVCMVSAANLVRQVVRHLSGQQDNLMKALFRGYLWALLSIGLVSIVHLYFCCYVPQLYCMPIIFFIPIDVYGFTIPIPIPLGTTGPLMEFAFRVVVFGVGVTGACVGGIELLRCILDRLSGRGLYASLLQVLLLSVFPGLNMALSMLLLVRLEPLIDEIVRIAQEVLFSVG